MNESGSGNINRIQTVPNLQPTWLKDLFSRLFWGLKPQWVEIRTGFLPANKTANRFPCQDHIERAKKNRYSHPAFLCAHCNHMHSTVFNAIIRVRFVSMPAYQPSSPWSGSRGGRQCRRFFGVCSPGGWCMFCSGRLCRHARKWFRCAQGCRGGGRRACICCVNTRPGFCHLSCAASADYIYILEFHLLSCLSMLRIRFIFFSGSGFDLSK